MTDEQTNELAQECGFTPAQVSMYQKELQRFSVVVRNQTLEDCAEICDSQSPPTVHQQLLNLYSRVFRGMKK